ncbi:fasciclin domain-containing protein [Leptolyngbya iicbica]|uniref:Fasciclin domain-containing protein n=2 Tax=Cyanophyceae TaxID=3028117 RepID=A0A4Q7EEK5_9CYAN|nr:fasciclin domain-containing protein [Leptolyngbya sp. LK]RZM79715.1 fasciclin domain-containing protein [Leptolyngbya sp. LK]
MSKSFFQKRLVIGLVGLGAIATLGACQASTTDTAVEPTDEEMATEEPMAMEEESGTIVDVAAGNETFSTLVQAVEAAGLADTLAAEGPYTVFAPTNEAFEALPEGTVEQLLQPENQETLTQILAYHVLPQEIPAAEVVSGDVDTAAGTPVSVNVDDATGNVSVNEATVVQADVQASNGVIHAIDQVLLPPDVQL